LGALWFLRTLNFRSSVLIVIRIFAPEVLPKFFFVYHTAFRSGRHATLLIRWRI